ncbi:hypothetical protein EV702DRAFT_1051002 [Suillus placidus]|uniref:Uncharacterized protein n=1 Tax=Suillus placidus TaxID=48579 RepID=A0A9P6ZGT4_9AGAM|nr:hypothetical protein EV702DRAFT_1051002 [Suillus placidus]
MCMNIALSKKEIEVQLLEEGNAYNAAPSHRSVATWISMGLVIDVAQIALLIEIDGFAWSAVMHLREGFDADDDPDNLNVDILDDFDDDPADFAEISDTWTNSSELTAIPLPSNLGVDRCRHCMAEDLIPLEMLLHEGQANDALHNLRIHLCNKAILFQTTVTLVQQAVSLYSSIYTKTRKQMMQLELGKDQLQKYKPLLSIQMLKVRETSPSLGSGPLKSTWGVPITHGMRNALQDQWKEELMLVQLEMDWACNFFLWKATQWGDRMQELLAKHLLAFWSQEFAGSTQCYNPALSMSVLHTPPASPYDSENSGNEYWPLNLHHADIAATMVMAASRIRASILQYQMEADNTDDPSALIMHFKARLQWEIAFTWKTVPNHIFSSHLSEFHDVEDLGDLSRIVSEYHNPWWKGCSTILNQPWQWDQHWLGDIEDQGLILPEQVDETSVPSLLALKWIRERLRALIEEQQQGIQEKMVEIEMYTTILCRLKRDRGE